MKNEVLVLKDRWCNNLRVLGFGMCYSFNVNEQVLSNITAFFPKWRQLLILRVEKY